MPRTKTYNAEQVLQACMLVLWEHGYESSSMRQLEEATGLSAGSLYHAFGSKDVVYERALEHYLNTVIANRIQHYLQSASPVIDGIEGFLCSSVSANLENFPFQSCMLVNTAAELGQQKPGIGAVIRSGFKRIDIALRDAVERAQRAREIAPQFEASLLAGQLALMLPGLILAKRNGTHTDQLLATIRAMIRSWRIPEVPNNNQESDHD